MLEGCTSCSFRGVDLQCDVLARVNKCKRRACSDDLLELGVVPFPAEHPKGILMNLLGGHAVVQ